MKSSAKKPSVFLCHASEDKPIVRDLYLRLQKDGVSPWLDEENLLAGANWEREIANAVRTSDAVLVCLSNYSITKAGFVQKEIKFALDRVDEQPEGKIYLIPVRLEPCVVAERLSRWHWVDLFQEGGYEKLLRGIRSGAGCQPGIAVSPPDDSQPKPGDLGAYLVKASVLTASGRWLEAAHLYDEYCRYDSDNWEVHLYRAVAYANAKAEGTDLASLRAYNEAIALHPVDIDQRTRARLHAYRGGILKRLRRLEEAEAQLHLAEEFATAEYEKEDISYNLACIAAMRRKKQEMIALLRPLMRKRWWRDMLASELEYFAEYRDDLDLYALLWVDIDPKRA